MLYGTKKLKQNTQLLTFEGVVVFSKLETANIFIFTDEKWY